MATQHDEFSQTSSAMEPEHVSAANGISGTPPPHAVVGVKISSPSKTSSSSCSSPDSTLDHPFDENGYEPDNYTPDTTRLLKLQEDNKSHLADGANPGSGSSILSSEPTNSEVPSAVSQLDVIHHPSGLSSSNSLSAESPPSQTLSSTVYFSSASPCSALDDPLGKDDLEPAKNTPNSFPKLNTDNESGFTDSKKLVSESSILSDEPSNHEVSPSMPQSEVTNYASRSSSSDSLTTESPPMQVMERSADKSYRIPSSVFARDKSSNPEEWSVASNESLFSIHMGTMSFAKDHSFWHSGELGTLPEFSTSPDMCDFSPCQSPTSKSHELGISEADVLRENEDIKIERSLSEGRNSRISAESATSTKSFAFPILAGDVDKEPSLSMGTSIKSSPEPKQSQPDAQTKLHNESLPHSEPKTPAATENAAQSKWLSCFSCCSSRS